MITLIKKNLTKVEQIHFTEALSNLETKIISIGEGSQLVVTPNHRAKQLRLLPLLAINETTRFHIFTNIADATNLKPSVRASYWAAVHSLANALGLTRTVEITNSQRVLTRRKELAPTWELNDKNFTTPKTISDIVLHLGTYPILSALILAFILGHRLGDILRIQKSLITNIYFNERQYTAVRIVEGKTVPLTGPYTVFIPCQGIAASSLQLAKDSLNKIYLFLPPITVLEPSELTPHVEATELHIKKILIMLQTPFDFRSLRRGGLSLLGAMGFTDDQLLLLSRHTNAKQLGTYLNAGLWSAHTADTMTTMVSALETAIEQRASWTIG
jgi:hypothetical protein